MSGGRQFAGTWRILEMSNWDTEAADLVGPAHFVFRRDGTGGFRFVAVEGDMDCRFGERAGKALVEFTWEGNDECDPVRGRGWAVLDGDRLTGRIFFHGGDDSSFTAARDTTRRPPTGRGSGRRSGT